MYIDICFELDHVCQRCIPTQYVDGLRLTHYIIMQRLQYSFHHQKFNWLNL
jgi:hypothetical protein